MQVANGEVAYADFKVDFIDAESSSRSSQNGAGSNGASQNGGGGGAAVMSRDEEKAPETKADKSVEETESPKVEQVRRFAF